MARLLQPHRVQSKIRRAVKRREEDIEQAEMESGELNLVPYLDIVTNVMMFLLASSAANQALLQFDAKLPGAAPKAAAAAGSAPQAEPPLGLTVSVTKTHIQVWSQSGQEGTNTAPKAMIPLTGQDGSTCETAQQCQSNMCDKTTKQCVASSELPSPVFDYQLLNKTMVDIATRRFAGQPRSKTSYRVFLNLDHAIPFSTVVSVMAALRCKLPDTGDPKEMCYLPTDDEALQKAADPIDTESGLYDTTRAAYDPATMALFHEILMMEL